MKIFLDAGHGGTETGAIGHGMIEKNINLTVTLEVKRLLELNGQEVKLSRSADTTLDLTTRCNMANNWGADYFISIHHNANDGATSGTEIYCSVGGGEGYHLAHSIICGITDRSARVIARESEKVSGQDYYAVIRQTEMPAIITEYGYMDSGDYINFDEQSELMCEAKIIAVGILKHLGINEPKLFVTSPAKHWAKDKKDYLVSKGIVINEERFDDNITRGEVLALLAQFI